MIQINYEGLDSKMTAVAQKVNILFRSADFYDLIRKHKKFDMANVPPAWIADILEFTDMDISLDFYYSIHPFSKAIVYDDAKDLNVIKLNKWNLNKPEEVLCNAIIHQCVHAVNAAHPQYSFGHGDDGIEGKQNTAPVWIADLAQKILSGESVIREVIQHEEICDYSSVSSMVLQVRLQNSTWFQTYLTA